MENQSDDSDSSGNERSAKRNLFNAVDENDFDKAENILNNFKGDLKLFVNAQDANNNNNTPLHMAIIKRSRKKTDKEINKKIITLLIEKEADINIRNTKDKTSLNLVEEQFKKNPNDDSWQSVKKLLEHSVQHETQPRLSLNKGNQSRDSNNTENVSPLSRLADSSPTQPSCSGIKRTFDDSAIDDPRSNIQIKRQTTDPTYAASGVKQALHGTIYQLQLLILFVQRGIKNHQDFCLATEMNAAEKFDDVVFKYKKLDQAKIWSWDFLQAKHKQDSEHKKISVNDLTTATDGDFSLQKYFISFCKIKGNLQFQGADLNNFTICTNTGFDFGKKTKHKSDGELVSKYEGYFEEKKDLYGDKILYFEGEKGKEIRYKSNDQTIAAIAQEIKSALLKSALESKEIQNLSSAKDKLKTIQVIHWKDLIEQTNKEAKAINEDKEKLGKTKVVEIAKKILKLKGKFLEANEYKDLDIAIKKLEETPAKYEDKKDLDKKAALDEAINDVLEKAKSILDDTNKVLEEAEAKLDKYKAVNSEESKGLKRDQKNLSDVEAKLKEIKEVIAGSDSLEILKREIEKDLLKERINFSNVSNLKEVKDTIDKSIDKAISEITVIQVALNNESFENNIREFLKKFRFVVNYPNVDKLNTLIGEEIGHDFKLLNADLVTHSFQKDMLDWFKEKGGKFLSQKDGNGFFNSIKEKINTLMTSGLGKAYSEKLSAYGIGFKNNLEALNGFLFSKDDQILHISTSSTRLSAIKVLQTLKRFDKYKNHDSYILVRLRTLLRQETQEYARDAFSSKKNHDLLVIECQAKTQGEVNEIWQLYDRLFTALINADKKIILVAQCYDILATHFKNSCKYKSINDQSNFKDLDSISQDHLLKDISVNLQKITPLGEEGSSLEGNHLVLDDLISKDSAENIIDMLLLPDLVERLIEKKPLNIGDTQAFSSIGYVKDYYIERQLLCQRIKNEVLMENASSDLFFVTGVSEVDLVKLEAKEDNIHTWEEGKRYDQGIILSALGLQSEQEIFQKLCYKHSEKNIHWLEYQNGHLYWKASKGKLSGLENYIYKNDFLDGKHVLQEKYFSQPENVGQKVVILANDPGVGKSTVLTSIAREMKQKDSALWVVRINLNDYAIKEKETSLEKIDFQENDINGSIDFVTKMAISGASLDPDIQLQKNLFKAGLKGDLKPKIVILFDGFDEISPSYKPNTTKLIKALKGSNLSQLWITTRVHEKTHLEEELESPAYILNDLTEEEQTKFLNKFWRWSLMFFRDPYNQKIREKTYQQINKHLEESQQRLKELIESPYNRPFFINYYKAPLQDLNNRISEILQKHPNQEEQAIGQLESLQKTIDENDENGNYNLDFSTYATVLLSKWKASIKDTKKEFTNVPLNLKMLAELIFEKKFQLPQNLELFDLYDEFIKIKFDILRKEKATGSGNITVDGSLAGRLNASRRVHHELAVKLFFPEKYNENKLPGLDEFSRFKEDYEKGTKEGEELARIGLLTLKGNQPEFIHRSFAEYFLSEYLVRNFRNEQVQKLLLEEILLKEDYSLIRKFFNDQLEKNPLSDIAFTTAIKEYLDQVLRNDQIDTVLHRVVQEKHFVIVKFLIEKLKDDKDILKKLMLATDKNGETALYNAAGEGHTETVKALLEFHKDHFDIIKELVQKNSSFRGRIALHRAAEEGHGATIKVLLDSLKGHSDILKAVMLATDHSENTALHRAVMFGHTKTVKVLLEFARDNLEKHCPGVLKELVLATDDRGKTALGYSVEERYIETLEAFLKSVQDYSDILKAMILATDNHGETILHCVAGKGHTEMMKAMLMSLKDHSDIINDIVLATDQNGLTALHLASFSSCHETVKVMLEFLRDHIEKDHPGTLKKLALMCYDCMGETLLHYMSTVGYTEGCKILLDSVKNDKKKLKELVLATNHFGQTALHRAAMIKNGYPFQVLKDILNSLKDRPDILEVLSLSTEQNREIALSIPAEKHHSDTVKFMLSFMKGNVIEDTFKELVLATLHKTAMPWEDSPETIKALLDFARDQLEKDYPGIVEELVLVTDQNGQTALHLAAKTVHEGDLETIKIFLDFVGDHLEKDYPGILQELVLVKDHNGVTALHMVAKTKSWFAIETLLKCFNVDSKFLFKKLEEEVWRGNRLVQFITYRDNYGCAQDLLDSVKNDKEKLKELLLTTIQDRQTILHWAAWGGRSRTLEILLKSVRNDLEITYPGVLKSLVLATDKWEQTALHLAAKTKVKPWEAFITTKTLLDFVRDHLENDYPGTLKDLILATDNRNQTVLHLAVKNEAIPWDAFGTVYALSESLQNHSDILKDLVLATDNNAKTALDLAIEKGHQSVVDVLKDVYKEITSRLLGSETKIADFSDNELRELKSYLEGIHYKNWDEQEILNKINAELTSRPQLGEEDF